MVETGDSNQAYSPAVGFLYIFNLIVGTGALALPKAFQSAGYLLSIVLLLISAVISYISATFICEALSVANAVKNKDKRRQEVEYDDVSVSESGPSNFEITQRVEVSAMANMFLSRAGVLFSSVALNVYLFGDLAIYSTTVPKSMMNMICASINTSTVQPEDPCQEHWPHVFTRFMVYRLCVLAFICICLPMIIVGVTKTKYLQLATSVSRWTAFSLMIFLASLQLATDGAAASPPPVNLHGFGSLFGVTVYAFMCHHSLPSLVTPMSSKSRLFPGMTGVYSIVLLFYFTLSVTGAFAFKHVEDVYTLNFFHDDNNSALYFLIDHFLVLFPIFTLTTNYPIVGITLINNIKVLKDMIMPVPEGNLTEEETLLETSDDERTIQRPHSRSIRKVDPRDLIIPAVVIALPTCISLFTDNVLLLASITGSYPGVGVQFIIPCLLVLAARSYSKTVLNFPVPKKHQSPFTHPAWIYAIFGWAFFSILMVTLNMFHLSF
ncbi:unnamed protein product, partial [Mesorhabditis belari]|uniref:Amino acid transporter transmembrane domain-containing protein n=1 Tax=Mesorhabditis belari TaxID=2138241 RepID=A0AAF3FKY6_9BILA